MDISFVCLSVLGCVYVCLCLCLCLFLSVSVCIFCEQRVNCTVDRLESNVCELEAERRQQTMGFGSRWPPLGPVLFHQYLSFRFSFEKKNTINLHTICMIYIDHHWALVHQYLSFCFSIIFLFLCQQGIMWNVQALPKAKQTQEFPSCNNSTAFKTGQTFGQDLKYLLLPKTEHGNEETHFSIMKWSFVADIPE